MRKKSPFGGPASPPLPLPPPDLNCRKLPLVSSGSSAWFRIYRNDLPRPKAKYFGRSGTNRFDALKNDFGVLYVASSIHCSFVEVWLRCPNPRNAALIIDRAELAIRSIAQFKLNATLKLVDLTGFGLGRLGLDAAIIATRKYKITGVWSSAFHAHPSRPDGILYSSRLNPGLRCIALFERAAAKIDLVRDERLDGKAGRRMIAPSFKHFDVGLVP